VIWTGLGSLVLLVVMIEICGALPADPFWIHQAAYDVILGAVPRIVAASLIAYFVGEFSNSYVLAKCKVRTHGNFMFFRFVLSTVIGQFRRQRDLCTRGVFRGNAATGNGAGGVFWLGNHGRLGNRSASVDAAACEGIKTPRRGGLL
jgi:Putative vitamin uptake transporter